MSIATQRQTWALFCGTKLDCRNIGLSLEKASDLIGRMKNGENIVDELVGMGAVSKGEIKPKVDFDAIYNEAHEAGMKAGNEHNPRPMHVVGYGAVMDGVCGFAWVKFAGNTAWARWCKKNGRAKASSEGGYYIWVSYFNQSMERKYKYASAFAKVLQSHGISAYAYERID